MTAEPKFVPEEAVEVSLDGGAAFSVRLIDCVGYMVPGAVGQFEDLAPRMVMTPWFDHEIPMTEAAEIGTRKVITDHSTVGVVVTTDGSVTEIPRADYEEAEERVIRELQEIGKPFVVVLNSAEPGGARAASLAAEIEEKYGVRCMPVNCLELSDGEIQEILRGLLYEFPLQELDLFLPALGGGAAGGAPRSKPDSTSRIAEQARELDHIRELAPCMDAVAQLETVDAASVRSINLRHRRGGGGADSCPRSLFYSTLSEQSGLTVADDGDLHGAADRSWREVRAEYDKVADALQAARGRAATASSMPERGGAEPGGSGDRAAGGTLRRAHEGERPVDPHDPGGHRDGRLAHRGQREAVRGHGKLSAAGVRGATRARSGIRTSSAGASTRSWRRTCRPKLKRMPERHRSEAARSA